MKIKFWHWSLVVVISCLLLIFIFSFIPKKTFLNSYLVVDKITTWENSETDIQCQVVLIWPKKLWKISNNLEVILRIFNLDLNWEVDLSQYQLTWLNSEKIAIKNFDNGCLWTFRPVLVQLKSENLTRFFWKKLFNF